MDLGDFQKEFDSIGDKPRYIKRINPRLNDESFMQEAIKIYAIAKKTLYEPHFDIANQELKDIYKNALLYFRGDERSKYSLDKGLFVFGGTGCGKSLFFEIFKEYTKELNCNSFVKSKQIKIIADVSKNGIDSLKNYAKQILYIDDFGSGNTRIVYFGNEFDVMDELIQERYDNFIKDGTITHMSTNIAPAEFKERFNERITSRLNSMFNVIDFPTEDYRRVKM